MHCVTTCIAAIHNGLILPVYEVKERVVKGMITSMDVDAAFEQAKECSETLDQLLQKAKSLDQPDPELTAQISGINKTFNELKHYYVALYRKRYGRLKERTIMIAI